MRGSLSVILQRHQPHRSGIFITLMKRTQIRLLLSAVSLLGGQNNAREDGVNSPGQRHERVTRLGKDGVLMERSNKVQACGRRRGGSEVEEKGGQEKTERSLEKC